MEISWITLLVTGFNMVILLVALLGGIGLMVKCFRKKKQESN